jgi:xylan 1,4-beta-xylosidase
VENNGRYYYSFARNAGDEQYVMRSDSLTSDQSKWTILGDFFKNTVDPSSIIFSNPNHCSPVVMLDDGSNWVISQAYSQGNGEWQGIGRQGLLTNVYYNSDDKPESRYPSNSPMLAPNLHSSGIPCDLTPSFGIIRFRNRELFGTRGPIIRTGRIYSIRRDYRLHLVELMIK